MTKTKNIYLVPVRKKDKREIVSDARVHNGDLKNAIDFGLPQENLWLAYFLDGKLLLKKSSDSL